MSVPARFRPVRGPAPMLSRRSATTMHRASRSCGFGLFLVLLLSALPVVALHAAPLPLAEAERVALSGDAGAAMLRARAGAARQLAIADSQLPDPALSVGALNLPVDTLAFDQERMTQLRVALRQQFPGGDALDRRRSLRNAEASGFDAATALRALEVRRAVRIAWLDLAELLRVRELLQEAQPLFSALEEAALAAYRQGGGRRAAGRAAGATRARRARGSSPRQRGRHRRRAR
mgnify:CR=1 FL=1